MLDIIAKRIDELEAKKRAIDSVIKVLRGIIIRVGGEDYNVRS